MLLGSFFFSIRLSRKNIFYTLHHDSDAVLPCRIHYAELIRFQCFRQMCKSGLNLRQKKAFCHFKQHQKATDAKEPLKRVVLFIWGFRVTVFGDADAQFTAQIQQMIMWIFTDPSAFSSGSSVLLVTSAWLDEVNKNYNRLKASTWKMSVWTCWWKSGSERKTSAVKF